MEFGFITRLDVCSYYAVERLGVRTTLFDNFDAYHG